MLDLDVQTLLLLVASASARQRHQAIARLREQMSDLAVRRLCRWLGVDRDRCTAHWQQQAGEQEDEARQVMEHILQAFPGSRYRRAAHTLQRAGARMNDQRVARMMCEQCCLWQGRRERLPASGFAPRIPSLS